MKTQIHINACAPSRHQMQPISQGVWQPKGGLWTFSHDRQSEAFAIWTSIYLHMDLLARVNQRWQRLAGRPCFAWRLYVSPSARIASVDSLQDWLNLGNKYGWLQGHWDNPGSSVMTWFDPGYSIDFLALARDYDALHITDKALETLESPLAGKFRIRFWHAESTCWFRWCFDRIKKVGLVKDYVPPTYGVSELFAARNIRSCT